MLPDTNQALPKTICLLPPYYDCFCIFMISIAILQSTVSASASASASARLNCRQLMCFILSLGRCLSGVCFWVILVVFRLIVLGICCSVTLC